MTVQLIFDKMPIYEMVIWLLVVHCVCDFALQSSAMSKYKNPDVERDESVNPSWRWWLTAHATIQGGGVYLVTGLWYLFLAETFMHWIIDYSKMGGRIDARTDQCLHIFCKLAWVYVCVSYGVVEF